MPAPTSGQLRNLDPFIIDNVGGVEALWYADVQDVLHVPDPADPLISTDIQLVPGASWYQLVATRTTLGFTQDGKTDRHGLYFQSKLKGVLAKATPTVAAGLEALDTRRFLLLYRDHNGFVWLVGSPDEPFTFTDKYDAGTATARNNYDFLFSGETTRRARPYEGAWLVSGVGLESGVNLGAGGGLVKIVDAAGNLMATAAAGQTVVVRSAFLVEFSII